MAPQSFHIPCQFSDIRSRNKTLNSFEAMENRTSSTYEGLKFKFVHCYFPGIRSRGTFMSTSETTSETTSENTSVSTSASLPFPPWFRKWFRKCTSEMLGVACRDHRSAFKTLQALSQSSNGGAALLCSGPGHGGRLCGLGHLCPGHRGRLGGLENLQRKLPEMIA